jgi:hypothetical protein
MEKNIKILLFTIFIISVIHVNCQESYVNNFAQVSIVKRQMKFGNDEQLLTYIQKHYFDYMWTGAEPSSGLARVRLLTENPERDKDLELPVFWSVLNVNLSPAGKEWNDSKKSSIFCKMQKGIMACGRTGSGHIRERPFLLQILPVKTMEVMLWKAPS